MIKMNIRKKLDNIIKKKQVGFEIVSTDQGRVELAELFKELERITGGQVRLISTKSPVEDRGIRQTEPSLLIAWIFENNPTQI